jgi:hypothetical protein
MLAGNNIETIVYPVCLREESFWAGSKNNLSDPFNLGNFRYEAYDISSGELIYRKGFSSLYNEWLTTDEAKTTRRSFYEVVTMPYPKNKIKIIISIRDRNGLFKKLYERAIDPYDIYILKEDPLNIKYKKLYGNGDSHTSVDIAFIAEGYKADEMCKFRSDIKKMAGILFSESPFKENKEKFNIWEVDAISQDSGTDIPGEHIFANTALNTSFYTFNLERYLTTLDLKSVNDFASVVPHDLIVILTNSSKYGGGGIYNYYCVTTSDNKLSEGVFIHELGHCFAGLADEYYSSSVTYNNFYQIDVEPWEPNITTLVNFETKWKDMISNNIPIPTPAQDEYKNITGVFEGGGYSSKGIFRPEIDCRMKTNNTKGFCAVCKKAINNMIGFYTK